MVGSRTRGRTRGSPSLLAVTATVAILVATVTAMAQAGPALKGADLEQARRLYAQLKSAHEEQRARQCLELAGTLLDYYPTFDRNDEVLVIAVAAADGVGDRRHALALSDELLADHPGSPLLDGAIERAAAIALAGGDSLRSAHYRLLHYDRDPARGQRADGVPQAVALLEQLSAGQLSDLVLFHPDSAMLPWLQCRRVAKLLEAGRESDARHLVARLEETAPGDRWTVEALNLVGLASPEQAAVRLEPDGPVRVRQIGVLCPLSGRYAELGGAFAEAARLAVAHANAELDRNFSLVFEDTGGDPVEGALAARRLCIGRGSIALFGDLLSDPTAAAAVVAEQYAVPLISPTATNDRLWEIGANVFQTNLPGLHEPRLLAAMAIQVLLKRDFAVLHPDDAEGRRLADAFTAEIEHLGGRLVARAAFVPEGTDALGPLRQVRERRPEVIYVPATAAQAAWLVDHLPGEGFGALVLGTGAWNDASLLAHAGASLDGAIIPVAAALFPAGWARAFDAAWPVGTLGVEADQLALQTYRSLRLLLDTLAASGARTRGEVTAALRRRMTREELETGGAATLADVVRVVRGEKTEPFPAALFGGGGAPDR
ncbi:MAG: branched-chain amino acid ABC transporter substrate-binding protein [bacterium]|nr:branched-chain amino acid ABC transporter substrate-binding protein [bacterium]